jgi:hypothetical protein
MDSPPLRLLVWEVRECSVPTCSRDVRTGGYCSPHYQRACRGADLSAPVQPRLSHAEHPFCKHPGCERVRYGARFCELHDVRDRRGADMDAPVPKGGTWYKNTHGYMQRQFMKNGQRVKELQHRVVMAEMLRRELLPEENVHHRNGARADNRPENLELWSTSQPSGQRAIDKLEWARGIIALYGEIDVL